MHVPEARTAGIWLLIAALPMFLAATYVVPFLGIVQWSVTLPTLGIDNYARTFSDPIIQSVFLRTFRICAIVTLAAVSIAYVLSYMWVYGSRRQQVIVELCIIIPFWISVLTRAFGWLVILYNRGILNTWLIDIGVISAPLTLVRNEFGVIVGIVHFLVPFAVFPLASSMRQVDDRVLLAARGLGAGRLRTFWAVFVPMTLPGIVGAAVIVFVFSLGFFITPAILGGGRSIMVAEFVFVQLFHTTNWGLAAAVSVVLVSIVALLISLMLRLTRVEKFAV
jgi:putative spermidine/putrescine transport system permease protein